MRSFFLAVFLISITSIDTFAGVKVAGKGATLHFDSAGFPPAMRANYEIMKSKCVKCHTMERTVVAVTTGIAPITMQPFDRTATKQYGIKMMRKPDSNMNKEEVKATVELLNYLLDEASR